MLVDIIVIPLFVLLISYFTSNRYFSRNAQAGTVAVTSVIFGIYLLVRLLNG